MIVKVEIWSDVACPWCYVGKRRFESALRNFEHAGEVEVVWRSFELDPRAPSHRQEGVVEHLSAKYGLTPEAARAMVDNLERVGVGEGLDLRLAATAGGNTFDAHRLLHLAHRRGRQGELKEALLAAYFTAGRAIAEPSVLVEVAEEAGLDRAEVQAVLESDDHAEAVRRDEEDAYSLGISGVPFFVLDRAFAVAGAQESDVMLDALRRAWARAHPLERVGGDAGAGCDGGSCPS